MDQNDAVGNNTQLEIKVISAKNLWAFNFFQKLTVYAVASLSSSDDNSNKLSKQQMQEQRTPTDPDGDGHPYWNHTITFNLSDLHHRLSDLFLKLDLRHQAGIPFPDRTIGVVKVPLSDLLDDSSSSGGVRFVDYQVRSPDGKPNGELRFAYNVINPRFPNDAADSVYPPVSISGYPKISDDPPVIISGYPKISDAPDNPVPLYPAAADLSDTTPAPVTVPEGGAGPPAYQNHAVPGPLPPPPPPMWGPPPPYWGAPGYMHRHPPPPPPGYFHQGWNY